MKKIGILGGTFNPIHNAHIMIARAALEQFGLDEVRFMTSANPPHKKSEKMPDAKLRYEMVSLALEGEANFIADDYELHSEEYSYSANTLAHFRKAYPSDDFFFIIGYDSLCDIGDWYMPRELMKLCTLLVYPRGSEENAQQKIAEITGKYGGRIELIDAPVVGISSTDIRERVRDGKSIKSMVPEDVCDFIKIHKLYTGEPVLSDEEKIRAALKPERYKHTIGVCDTAVKMAKLYGVNEQKAYKAALFHDCAKQYDKQKQLDLCIAYGLKLDKVTLSCPPIIHAPLSAEIAKRSFNVNDEEVLDAIRCHTVGKAGMSPLEKIIYIADMIEPGRDFEGVEKIRKTAFENLDRALMLSFRKSLEYNIKKWAFIHPDTLDAWNYTLMYAEKNSEEI